MKRSALATAIKLASTGVLAGALVACGGSGGGDPTPTTSSVTSTGTVTGFGSVYVGDDRFATNTGTTVTFDDNPSLEDQLRLGMKVRVTATRTGSDDPVAESIVFDEDFQGPIVGEPDTTANTFVVAGQTITVDTNTVFDDSIGGGITVLTDGMVVEVSGFPTADGFLATRVEQVGTAVGGDAEDDTEFEIKTTIDAGNVSGTTLTVNGQDIDVSAVQNQLAALGLSAEGVFVEIKGNFDPSASPVTYAATSIEAEDRFGNELEDEGEFEIEGILQAFDDSVTPNTVTINNIEIEVTGAGVSALANLVGKKVELEGTVNASGELVLPATGGVKVERENNARTEDVIASISPDGTVTTRLGLEITVDASTPRKEIDKENLLSGTDGDNLNIADFRANLQTGDWIEARGVPGTTPADTEWRRVEVSDDSDDGCELRGPVSDVNDPTFVILGVTVDTTSTAVFQNGFMSKAEFFDALEGGPVVKAETDTTTDCTNGNLTADEVEIQVGDDLVGTVSESEAAEIENREAADNELVGTPSSVAASSFDLNGSTITVNSSTLIDDSLIEAAQGGELPNDLPFGNAGVTATLNDLVNGVRIEVQVNNTSDNIAISIEDAD